MAGSAATLAALGAGCLNDGGLIGDGDENADDPGSGSPSGEDGDDGDADAETLSSIEVADGLQSAAYVQYSHSQPPSEATAELFTSADSAESWIEGSQIEPDGPAATALRETDFESARAVVIEGQAPDGCHQLTVSDVSLDDDGAISVSASVEPEDDGGDMCTQQLTAEGAVVRATTTAEPPNEASVTLSLPDGSSVGMGMAVGSASDSESDSDDE